MDVRALLLEAAAARADLLAFIALCPIEERALPGSVAPARIPPHVERLAALATATTVWDEDPALGPVSEPAHNVVVLKSRQVYVSWFLAQMAVWRAMYEGWNILVYSMKLESAVTFLKKAYFIADRLPPHLRVPRVGPPNQTKIEFEGGGLITSFASTPDSGRSERANLVIMDEAAFHPYARENFAAWQPTIQNHPMGHAFVVSTMNRGRTFFNDLWENPHWERLFIPWNPPGIPGRDEGWYERTRAMYPGSSDDFRREYPATVEEAMAVFDDLVFSDFDRARHAVANDPAGWGAYRRRIVSYDPGGNDKNALLFLGVDRDGHCHVHDLFYESGAVPISDVIARVRAMHVKSPVDLVTGDFGPKSPFLGEFQRAGFRVRPARKDIKARRGLISQYLRNGRLTVNRERGAPLLHEFESTWWRRNAGIDRVDTDGSHHADALDALGYALQEVVHTPRRKPPSRPIWKQRGPKALP